MLNLPFPYISLQNWIYGYNPTKYKGGITMQHYFEVITVELGGKKRIRFRFNNESQILSVFLSSDIQSDPIYFYEYIDKVLTGESERVEISGNVCYLDISKNTTKVGDLLSSNLVITDEDWCEISTLELRGLIGLWIEENRKFYKKEENVKKNSN